MLIKTGWLVLAFGVLALLFGASESAEAESYRERLRREITDRARDDARRDYLVDRDRRRDDQDRDRRTEDFSDRFAPFTGDFHNPFGDGPPDGLLGRGGEDTPRDLSGRPLGGLAGDRERPDTPGITDAEREERRQEEAVSASDWAAGAVAQAQVLFNNGEYGAARRTLAEVVATRRIGPADKAPAAELLDEIDELGQERFSQARNLLAEGRHDEAREALTRITTEFAGCPIAQLARHKRLVMEEEPRVAAAWLLNQAKEFAEQKRMDVARLLLKEVIEHYAETDAARSARTLLDRIEEREAMAAVTRDQELNARRWLIIGDIHAANGRLDSARESYERVIEEFDDTPFADSAREKISALREGIR